MCILVNLQEYFTNSVFSSTSGQSFFYDLLAFQFPSYLSFWLSFLEALKHVHNVNHMSIPAASRIRTSVIASTCVQYCWAER